MLRKIVQKGINGVVGLERVVLLSMGALVIIIGVGATEILNRK